MNLDKTSGGVTFVDINNEHQTETGIMNRKIEIAPSILSADFANLGNDIKKCENGGAHIIHFDVMDGHFVPNITIGPLVAKAIRPITQLPIDCHLMISEPDRYIEDFVKSGANMISVHAETVNHMHRTLDFIQSLGAKPGIALNPATPMEFAYEASEYCDFILLMSVNPGFGGQRFIPSFLRRCSDLRNYLDKNGLENVRIQVDGGVKIENAEEIVRAGADILVCGSGLFKGNLIENIAKLQKSADRGANG